MKLIITCFVVFLVGCKTESDFPLGLHSEMTLEDVQNKLHCKLENLNVFGMRNWSFLINDTIIPRSTLKEYSLAKKIEVNEILFGKTYFEFDTTRQHKLTQIYFTESDMYFFDPSTTNTNFKKKLLADKYQYLEKQHQENLKPSGDYFRGFVYDAYLKDQTVIAVSTSNERCEIACFLINEKEKELLMESERKIKW